MKKCLQQFGALALALVLTLLGCLYFARMKSGLFIDEIYTYGLSNSHYAPFMTDVAGGELRDRVLTRQQFLDYLVVNDGEALDFASVYYNQVNDVHPPLYYWLLNAVCSLTPNVFSYWSGLILDLVIYLYAVALLYFLVLRLYGQRLNAAIAALLYGLSMLGLSTMLMIRMYVLMTALTVQLALIVAAMLKTPKRAQYPLLCLTLFLGLMTQYYFVFYAFFLCAAYVLWALTKREWKRALVFALWAFAGVGLLLLAFPACLDHLFAEKMVSGGNALENLGATSQYAARLSTFLRATVHGLHAAMITGLIAYAAFVILAVTGRLRWYRVPFPGDSLVVLVPALPTLLLVAIISPVVEVRYVYNIVPILVAWVSLLLSLFGRLPLCQNRAVKTAALALIAALTLWQARAVWPEYLYLHYRDYDAIAEAHSAAPCIFFDNNYFSPITEDMQQLMKFDEVFVTADPDSEALRDYLTRFPDAEEAVVYIDSSKFWSSGFEPEDILPRLLENTAFTAFDHLYTTGLSRTYLLTKNETQLRN